MKMVDRRKKKVLRKKPCIESAEKCLIVILVKSLIKWAGQVERTVEDCLPCQSQSKD